LGVGIQSRQTWNASSHSRTSSFSSASWPAETDVTKRELLESLLTDTRRHLALIEANEYGALWSSPQSLLVTSSTADPVLATGARRDFEASSYPLLLIDPRPGLRIIDANRAYVEATMIEPDRAIGEKLFDVFPDNPDDPVGTGVSNLFASLNQVVETGQPHVMAIQRYDIRDPAGAFVERYWQPLNTPVIDNSGKVTLIVHQVIDVTEEVRRHGPPPGGAS
jgi:PAS domain-containing protein